MAEKTKRRPGRPRVYANEEGKAGAPMLGFRFDPDLFEFIERHRTRCRQADVARGAEHHCNAWCASRPGGVKGLQDVPIERPLEMGWGECDALTGKGGQMPQHVILESFDLNDPELSFDLTVTRGVARLGLMDWRGRPLSLTFHNVYRAALFRAVGFRGLPEARLLELTDSPELQELLQSGLVTAGEGLRHFVISTNEDQWAEFVASDYESEQPAP